MSPNESHPIPRDSQNPSPKSHTPIGVGLVGLGRTRDPRLAPKAKAIFVVRWVREDGRDVKQRFFTRLVDALGYSAKLAGYGKEPEVFVSSLERWSPVAAYEKETGGFPFPAAPPAGAGMEEAVEARLTAQQLEVIRQKATRADTRAEFTKRRDAGLAKRHATRLARQQAQGEQQ